MFCAKRLFRLRNCVTRSLGSLNSVTNKNVCADVISKNHLIRQSELCALVIKQYSSLSSSIEEDLVDSNTYEKVCEETLESLTDFFDNLVENTNQFESGDVSYSDGVLTVNLGNEHGTYVINRQAPNRQIWLSSPTSGPKRYDFIANGSYWIYKHDMKSLHELLEEELSKILGKSIDLSKCFHVKR